MLIAPKSLSEICQVMRTHYQASLSHYGVHVGARIIRKHLAAYLDQAFGKEGVAAEMRDAILVCHDPQQVLSSIDRLCESAVMARAA